MLRCPDGTTLETTELCEVGRSHRVTLSAPIWIPAHLSVAEEVLWSEWKGHFLSRSFPEM